MLKSNQDRDNLMFIAEARGEGATGAGSIILKHEELVLFTEVEHGTRTTSNLHISADDLSIRN
jgi:hypothetical protein